MKIFDSHQRYDTRDETLTKFVAASLQTDYTVDADLSDGYDTDADEQAAALANIAEMHRLLLVREERLFAAYDEVDKLRALHHTPYADAEHQGGNCVDAIMSQAAEIARLAAELADTRERVLSLQGLHSTSQETARKARAELATATNLLQQVRSLHGRRQDAEIDAFLGRKSWRPVPAEVGTVTIPETAWQEMYDALDATPTDDEDDMPFTDIQTNAAMQVVQGWLGSWRFGSARPVPAEAGDSTADEAPGARAGGRIGNFLTAQFGELPFMVRAQAWQACQAVVEQYRAGDSTADEAPGARWLSDREYEVGNQAADDAQGGAS